MALSSTSSQDEKQKPRRWRKRYLLFVPLIIIIVVVVLLLANSVILTNQTKPAHLTVAGAQLVHTSKGTLQVLDQGDHTAAPVVLIHGFASSLHWWDKLVPFLLPHYRVVRMDLLGDGGSENPPSGGYTVQDQATAIGEILQTLDVTHATVVGHSLGGTIATALAEQSPDDVARIVILDTSTHASNVSLGQAASLLTRPIIGPALKLLLDHASAASVTRGETIGFAPKFAIASGFENPNQVGLDLQAMTYTSFVENEAAAGVFTNAEPMETRLTAIGKPLLVIFGARDRIAIGEAHDLSDYRTVPGAQVVVLPGVGHTPQVEAPDRTAALMLAFMQR